MTTSIMRIAQKCFSLQKLLLGLIVGDRLVHAIKGKSSPSRKSSTSCTLYCLSFSCIKIIMVRHLSKYISHEAQKLPLQLCETIPQCSGVNLYNINRPKQVLYDHQNDQFSVSMIAYLYYSSFFKWKPAEKQLVS